MFFAIYIRDEWGKRLPVAEIEQAFILAAKNKFETDSKNYNTLSIAYIENILQAYMTYRHKLIVPTSSPAIPQNCELSQNEKDAIIWASCLASFEEFKNSGIKVDFGSVKYDFLKQRGMIPFDKQRRKEIMEKARQRVIAKSELKITTAKTLNEMQKIKNMILNGGKDFDALCLEEAKTIAVNTLFDELKENEMNLTDLIP